MVESRLNCPFPLLIQASNSLRLCCRWVLFQSQSLQMWQLTVLPQYWSCGVAIEPRDSPLAKWLVRMPCNLGLWGSKPTRAHCALSHKRFWERDKTSTALSPLSFSVTLVFNRRTFLILRRWQKTATAAVITLPALIGKDNFSAAFRETY